MSDPISILRTVAVSLALTALLALPSEGQTRLKELEEDIQTVISRVLPSVVRVDKYKLSSASVRVDSTRKGDVSVTQFGAKAERLNFSGMMVLRDGYILTVPEAISDAERIFVLFHDGRRFRARPVGQDRRSGIAVIEVEGVDFRTAAMTGSEEVRIGSIVVTVGNPFGLMGSPALGLVSGVRATRAGTPRDSFPLIQISAPVNPGDYGGAVANTEGEIVGVILSTYRQGRKPALPPAASPTSVMSSFFQFVDERSPDAPPPDCEATQGLFFEWLHDRYNARAKKRESQGTWFTLRRKAARDPDPAPEEINFVMPIRHAVAIAERIIEQGHAEMPRLTTRIRPWLGVTVQPVSEESVGEPVKTVVRGLMIIELVPHGPAARAGIRKQDIIRTFNGRNVFTWDRLQQALLETRIGQEVEVSVIRNGRSIQVRLPLQAPATPPGKAPGPVENDNVEEGSK